MYWVPTPGEMPRKVLYVPCLLESSQQTCWVVIGSIFQMRTLRSRELSDGQDQTVRSVILTHVGSAPGIFILRHTECFTVAELPPGGPSFAHEKACLPGRVCRRSSRDEHNVAEATTKGVISAGNSEHRSSCNGIGSV